MGPEEIRGVLRHLYYCMKCGTVIHIRPPEGYRVAVEQDSSCRPDCPPGAVIPLTRDHLLYRLRSETARKRDISDEARRIVEEEAAESVRHLTGISALVVGGILASGLDRLTREIERNDEERVEPSEGGQLPHRHSIAEYIQIQSLKSLVDALAEQVSRLEGKT